MRVCKYTVIGEVENYYQDNKDILSTMEEWDETVLLQVRTIDGGWMPYGEYSSLEEAEEAQCQLKLETRIITRDGIKRS